jgi:hypothetical protein
MEDVVYDIDANQSVNLGPTLVFGELFTMWCPLSIVVLLFT